MDHYDLIERGLSLHEARKYEKAIAMFQQAWNDHPFCPAAIYNYANTLYMLGRYEKSKQLLELLVDTDAERLEAGCPDVCGNPRSFKLDAYYLLFLVTLCSTKSWKKAELYAREHLKRRRRGLKSVWSKRTVEIEIEQLRQKFAK